MELAGPNASDPALADNMRTFVSVVGGSARMAGIPFPGTFILDPQGRVTSRFFEDSYIDRNTVSSILLRTGSGESVPATKISGAHLDVTAYPSDTAIAPGNRITLAFDVVPHADIHVYAPGADAQGYRPIAVRLDPSPLVRMFEPVYPPSETYVFEPLNERVSVYQKPFTLLQDILLEGTPQAQQTLRGETSITITGSLEYQACDDTICFNPESVPLSWTFTLRPIVFERPIAPNR